MRRKNNRDEYEKRKHYICKLSNSNDVKFNSPQQIYPHIRIVDGTMITGEGWSGSFKVGLSQCGIIQRYWIHLNGRPHQ